MKKNGVYVLLLGFAFVVTAAILQVSLRYKIVRTGYQIAEKLHEQRELEEDARKLRLELSMLRSPERVEKLAREQLGMVRPDPERIRVVRTQAEVALAREASGPAERR